MIEIGGGKGVGKGMSGEGVSYGTTELEGSKIPTPYKHQSQII